jgi:two-component system, chemotaxis family, protein-glutamate methylesterase/glutaminase
VSDSAAPLGVSYGLVVVGASWGGLAALSRLVADLPADLAVPVALVQHRSKESDHVLAQLLQERTELRVREVEDKEPIVPGHVYVAPPDYHMLVDLVADQPYFSLTVDPPVRYSRPSIDVTLMSAADAFGPRAVGVVLTGANEDGAAGLRRVADRSGYAIVQDPETAEIRTMPHAALRAVPTAEVLPLERIGDRLLSLVGRRLGAVPVPRRRHPMAAPSRKGARADGRRDGGPNPKGG